MRRMNWTWDDRSGSSVRMVDDECVRLKALEQNASAPFRGPLDRFRWSVTASYFMCWYSMQVTAVFIPRGHHLSRPRTAAVEKLFRDESRREIPKPFDNGKNSIRCRLRARTKTKKTIGVPK